MNSEIPTLWLIVSGVFFFLGIIVFAAILVVLVKLLKLAEDLKPRVDRLSGQVETLIVKVDRVADRVEEVATSAKGSIDDFRGTSSGIMGTIEHLAKSTATKSDMITPILSGGLAAYRIFMSIKASRANNPKPSKALAKKGDKG